ncbi:MAG: YicC/YloC family endoribonuclease [Lachnospiraceae bacterium]|jgi:uncharacterized protein (TIGR00255 family)
MVRSMTGFGRAEISNDNEKYTVEIKSVNNRYLDFNIRMPKKFNSFEAKIRNLLQERITRGKVDVYISSKSYTDEAMEIRFNEDLAREYLGCLKIIAAMDGVNSGVSARDIATFPDVITMEEKKVDESLLWEKLSSLLGEALDSFIEARELEGSHLRANIIEKLDILENSTRQIAEHEPEIMAQYRIRLRERLNEILEDSNIDETRVAQELVIYSDKICTDEETVRLLSHIDKMRKMLDSEGSIGRNLDFLTQEMNREANTILSKAGDVITADTAIILKTEIEKIREQIQNIE